MTKTCKLNTIAAAWYTPTTNNTSTGSRCIDDNYSMRLRLRAIELLYRRIPKNIEDPFNVARNIEEHIHNICFIQNIDYGAKVLQISWNLHTNGHYLLENYSQSQLVVLNDMMLAENTDIEKWWVFHNDRLRRQQELLSNDSKFEEDEQSSSHSELICNRCHSRLIDIQQQQTRSADEGMTVFCTCKKCGMRWKMY